MQFNDRTVRRIAAATKRVEQIIPAINLRPPAPRTPYVLSTDDIPFQWDPDLDTDKPCPANGAFVGKDTQSGYNVGILDEEKFSPIDNPGQMGIVGTIPPTSTSGWEVTNSSLNQSARETFINLGGEVKPGEYGLCSRATKRPVRVRVNHDQLEGLGPFGALYLSDWGLAPGTTELYHGLPGFVSYGCDGDTKTIWVRRLDAGVWWAKASQNWWDSTLDGSGGIWAYPYDQLQGLAYDGTQAGLSPQFQIRVQFWSGYFGYPERTWPVVRHPFLRTGDLFLYRTDRSPITNYGNPYDHGEFQTASDYTDDPVGTIRFSRNGTGIPGRHWVKMDGTANAYKSDGTGGSGIDLCTNLTLVATKGVGGADNIGISPGSTWINDYKFVPYERIR